MVGNSKRAGNVQEALWLYQVRRYIRYIYICIVWANITTWGTSSILLSINFYSKSGSKPKNLNEKQAAEILRIDQQLNLAEKATEHISSIRSPDHEAIIRWCAAGLKGNKSADKYRESWLK